MFSPNTSEFLGLGSLLKKKRLLLSFEIFRILVLSLFTEANDKE